MNNFLRRLFGEGEKKAGLAPVQSEQKPNVEDPELSAIREQNFRNILGEYCGRPIHEEEFTMVRNAMVGADASQPFPKFVGEEAMSWIKMHAKEFGLNPGHIPADVGGEYKVMGTKQGTFERALARALAKESQQSLTEDDLGEARAIFESDKEAQKQWEDMIGEEVEHYAESVARRMLVQRLREESRDDVSSSDQRMAAK